MTPPTGLERAILATIAYFDLFSYPLTTVEVWKWLYREADATPVPLGSIDRLMRQSPFLDGRLEEREGMFFLTGRGEVVELRKERYLVAERKFRRLRRMLRMFGALPFIRAVAVCNTLAYANARPESDLDVLIITKPGRIWTARLFATGIAKLLRWRPTPDRTRDTVCLSFYLSADALDLRPLALSDDDLYFRYWLDQLVPVMGDPSLINRLRSANAWYRERLPNAHGTSLSRRRFHTAGWLARACRFALELTHAATLGDALERAYRARQVDRLPAKLLMLANLDSRVIVNDRMLKFHDNDRREEFLARYGARIHRMLQA